jgi:hypothetical protein
MNKVEAKMYKGMVSPTVEFPQGSSSDPQVFSVSLESLDEDYHDQSYGMMDGTMGCFNNPGGPGC